MKQFRYSSMLLATSAMMVLCAAPAKASPGANKPAAPQPETGKLPPAQPAPQVPLTAGAAQFQAASTAKYAYDLEDDVPLPVKKIGVKGETAYPFPTMNVNQSFFVPATDKLKAPWTTLTSMASKKSRELHPKKFVTSRDKKLIDGVETDGVRVWRTEDAEGPLPPPRPKPVKKEGSADALAAEAEAGDTSTKGPQAGTHEPDFQ